MVDKVKIVGTEGRQQSKGKAHPQGCPCEGVGLGVESRHELQKAKVEPRSELAKPPTAIAIIYRRRGVGAGEQHTQRAKKEERPPRQ